MKEEFTLKPIARMRGNFPDKFGIPRQSGLCAQKGEIVFEPEYRDENALRGMEGFSHLWLIWGFSRVERQGWRPTVQPPRLGGNRRMGVFATRSPYRPNPLGLSSVKLAAMEKRQGLGTVLVVEGADLMDGTPIYDIKPYLSFTDSHPDAENGFAGEHFSYGLKVEFPQELLERIPPDSREPILRALEQDPRPAYQRDPELPYGMALGELDVRFRVKDGVLRVFEVAEAGGEKLKGGSGQCKHNGK